MAWLGPGPVVPLLLRTVTCDRWRLGGTRHDRTENRRVDVKQIKTFSRFLDHVLHFIVVIGAIDHGIPKFTISKQKLCSLSINRADIEMLVELSPVLRWEIVCFLDFPENYEVD